MTFLKPKKYFFNKILIIYINIIYNLLYNLLYILINIKKYNINVISISFSSEPGNIPKNAAIRRPTMLVSI